METARRVEGGSGAVAAAVAQSQVLKAQRHLKRVRLKSTSPARKSFKRSFPPTETTTKVRAVAAGVGAAAGGMQSR